MTSLEPDRHFRAGQSLLARGRYGEAVTQFQNAIVAQEQGSSIGPRVRYMSYYSVSRALAFGPTREDLEACRRAVAERNYDAELWRNLAKVYLLIGKKTRALAAMERGLALEPGDRELNSMLDRADRRSRPVWPRLGRDHPINTSLGRLRSRWSRRSRAD